MTTGHQRMGDVVPGVSRLLGALRAASSLWQQVAVRMPPRLSRASRIRHVAAKDTVVLRMLATLPRSSVQLGRGSNEQGASEMQALLILLICLVILAIVAGRYGVDSRDGLDWSPPDRARSRGRL